MIQDGKRKVVCHGLGDCAVDGLCDRCSLPIRKTAQSNRHFDYIRNALIDQPWKIMSIAHRDWAIVGPSI